MRDAVCLFPVCRADAMLASRPTRAMAGLPVRTLACAILVCSAAIFSTRVSSSSSSSRHLLMSHHVAHGKILEGLEVTTRAHDDFDASSEVFLSTHKAGGRRRRRLRRLRLRRRWRRQRWRTCRLPLPHARSLWLTRTAGGCCARLTCGRRTSARSMVVVAGRRWCSACARAPKRQSRSSMCSL